jgi:hypothetical protein
LLRYVMRTSTALLALASADARELTPGQYAQVDPVVREWFRNQLSPRTGGNCCSEADGAYAEEDIRAGDYWTRWPLSEGRWYQVPDDVVIHDPNRNGAPVVWWYSEINPATGANELKIRCYAPGGGV